MDNGCVVVDGWHRVSRRVWKPACASRKYAWADWDGYRCKLRESSRWPLQLSVHSSNPVLACLGSQYAGWSLSHGEGKGGFQALGSGPGRAAACREDLFAELAYRDLPDRSASCSKWTRSRRWRSPTRLRAIAGCAAEQVTLILTPTRSLAGAVQIVARVLEVALHKAHALGFPLHHVVDGAGAAPLPPPAADFLTAMGRTNDAILFGGQVQLVRGLRRSRSRTPGA